MFILQISISFTVTNLTVIVPNKAIDGKSCSVKGLFTILLKRIFPRIFCVANDYTSAGFKLFYNVDCRGSLLTRLLSHIRRLALHDLVGCVMAKIPFECHRNSSVQMSSVQSLPMNPDSSETVADSRVVESFGIMLLTTHMATAAVAGILKKSHQKDGGSQNRCKKISISNAQKMHYSTV